MQRDALYWCTFAFFWALIVLHAWCCWRLNRATKEAIRIGLEWRKKLEACVEVKIDGAKAKAVLATLNKEARDAHG